MFILESFIHYVLTVLKISTATATLRGSLRLLHKTIATDSEAIPCRGLTSLQNVANFAMSLVSFLHDIVH